MKLEVNIKIVLDPKEAARAHKLMLRGHEDTHLRDVRDIDEKDADQNLLNTYDEKLAIAQAINKLVEAQHDR